VVTAASTIEEAFWSDLVRHEVSFLPGVPTTYAMLKRLGFGRRELPRLRALTQAGGRLAPELVMYFHELMKERGGRFFVMYGQTEASPRIACLPSERLPEKLGSVGLALRGGELYIGGPDGSHLPAGEAGEVIYRGPNVMMGYADTRDDLALPATYGDCIVTGDLGYLDDEGFLYLTGRTKRICKLADARVSLDDIESIAGQMLRGEGTVAAVDGGESGVFVFATALEGRGLVDFRHGLARSLGVPPKLIDVRAIERMPLLTSGKIDYPALKRFVDAGADTH
jgi:acyl-CoA synthetase (AMP-forming)/AMP-acid ligase II